MGALRHEADRSTGQFHSVVERGGEEVSVTSEEAELGNSVPKFRALDPQQEAFADRRVVGQSGLERDGFRANFVEAVDKILETFTSQLSQGERSVDDPDTISVGLKCPLEEDLCAGPRGRGVGSLRCRQGVLLFARDWRFPRNDEGTSEPRVLLLGERKAHERQPAHVVECKLVPGG